MRWEKGRCPRRSGATPPEYLSKDEDAGTGGRGTGRGITGSPLARPRSAAPIQRPDIIGFAPPLCITQAEVGIVVDAVREAIAEVI